MNGAAKNKYIYTIIQLWYNCDVGLNERYHREIKLYAYITKYYLR